MTVAEETREGFYLSEEGEWVPDGWIVGSLGNNGNVRPGYAFKSQHMGQEGIPLVKITEIQPPYVNMDSASHVDPEPYSKKDLSKFEIQFGDSLVAMTGATIGKVGKYLGASVAWLNQRVAKISSNDTTTDDFIHYVLKSPVFGRHVDNTSSGSSAQQNVSGGDLELYSFLLPPLPEQKAIAAVLGSLDDKIELLREQNETLEALAQTLFKRWFIDFNFPCLLAYSERTQADYPELEIYGHKDFGGLPQPAKGKSFIYVLRLENGNRYIGLTDFILRRYHEHKTGKGAKATKASPPVAIIHFEDYDSREEAVEREQWLKTGFGRKWLDREEQKGNLGAHVVQAPMIPSELGEIPEGWSIGGVTEFLQIHGGGTPKTTEPKYWDGDIKFFTPKDATDSFFCNSTEKHVSEEGVKNSSTKVFPKNTIFITARGTVGKCALALTSMAMNQSCYAFTEKNDNPYTGFLLLQRAVNILRRYATSGVFDAITTATLEATKVTYNFDVASQFEASMTSFFTKLINNTQQIQSLTAFRDTLLPKLMKGEIRIIQSHG